MTDPVEMEVLLKAQRKKYLLRLAFLIPVNTALYTLRLSRYNIRHHLFEVLCANVIGLTLIGFLLGLLVALLPYKGLSYRKKYLRAALLCVFVIQFIILSCFILLDLLRTFGW